ncbi:MAG: MFS transporter [Chloroflexi bacterium]|nr:MFS transporter [Chloroflexota bacterium]
MQQASAKGTTGRLYALGADVWKIAFSAFFADLGYQAVLAGLPLFLVLDLKGAPWVFGLATAIAYGPGAIIAYIGGRLGDRLGRKRIAVFGNALIPLLSFIGLTANIATAVGLFAVGWWGRNFRNPPRRAMLTEVVTPEQEGQAFGLLHALDIGGGTLAALIALILVAIGASFKVIFLITLAPLIISTVFVAITNAGAAPRQQNRRTYFFTSRSSSITNAGAAPRQQTQAAAPTSPSKTVSNLRLYRGVLVASALFGFSFYSLGFPILTAESEGYSGGSLIHAEATGILAYVLYLGVSAITGLAIGAVQQAGPRTLASLGYLCATIGSAILAITAAIHTGIWGTYLGVIVLGAALGVIETLEPTIVSRVSPEATKSRQMGALTAARSTGLFIGNIIMGLLYTLHPSYSYVYAALLALLATIILTNASAPRPQTA